ncbi:cucurbitadienol 11-hydroxylase-like isoform X2 [Juglans microcarpa x Juglans regia]|uniref:cucurbitadienol 11-hydroxylase-like isoform X2 n=1 Tax=Juglans microcarpa x Juglans regia TaxID=2249226 RepID=UPI001B7E830F|nr:cucurbitadienol 11-hydroxylase-like isoform X2 [Juglans microcarpa x Juglans regia]
MEKPKGNGVLPPGSMGLPFIGESLELLVRSYSLDLHPFIKKRVQRYGTIFRTSLVGRPVVVSTDPEFNHLIARQEGRLVEQWYLDSFSKLMNMEGENKISKLGLFQKHSRSITSNHFGADRIKKSLLPQIEQCVNKTLREWSRQPSVEVKRATSVMTFDFSAKYLFGYDAEKSPVNMSEKLSNASKALMAFPLNIPGTAYRKCLKDREEFLNVLRNITEERLASPEKHRSSTGDFLDQAINIEGDNDQKLFSSELVVNLLFALSFVSFESISSPLSLTIELLADHPSVLQELTVINETLRLGFVAPGLLRKVVKDIEYKGYTISVGWTVILANPALHLQPDTYKDSLAFNPWRWKDIDQDVMSKNFMPFGGGIRVCAGADYSKAFMATFLHVMVTKYRWKKVKGGDIVRNPILGFVDGIHVHVSEKRD